STAAPANNPSRVLEYSGAPAMPAQPRKQASHDRPIGDRLLMLLKTRGPQTAADLAAVLRVTGEAVRQQLVKLACTGLVEATSEPRGVGRPTQLRHPPENA